MYRREAIEDRAAPAPPPRRRPCPAGVTAAPPGKAPVRRVSFSKAPPPTIEVQAERRFITGSPAPVVPTQRHPSRRKVARPAVRPPVPVARRRRILAGVAAAPPPAKQIIRRARTRTRVRPAAPRRRLLRLTATGHAAGLRVQVRLIHETHPRPPAPRPPRRRLIPTRFTPPPVGKQLARRRTIRPAQPPVAYALERRFITGSPAPVADTNSLPARRRERRVLRVPVRAARRWPARRLLTGPGAPPPLGVYVFGDWPYAAVEPRSPAARVHARSPVGRLEPRSPLARAER